MEEIKLSKEDALKFIEVLENPPKPTQRLIELMRYNRDFVDSVDDDLGHWFKSQLDASQELYEQREKEALRELIKKSLDDVSEGRVSSFEEFKYKLSEKKE